MPASSRLSFLSLPVELRIQIYKIAFRNDPGVIVIHSCGAGPQFQASTGHALFLTSKQIRKEAREEYQIELSFCLHPRGHFHDTTALNDYERKHIVHISVTKYSELDCDMFSKAEFPALRDIMINDLKLVWYLDCAALGGWDESMVVQTDRHAPEPHRPCLKSVLNMLKKEEHKDKIVTDVMLFAEDIVINDPGSEQRGYSIIVKATIKLRYRLLSLVPHDLDAAEAVST